MGKKSASGPTRKDRRIAELEAEVALLRNALGEAEQSVGQLTRAAEYARSFSRAIACEAAHMRHQSGIQASILSLAGRIHEIAEHALPDPDDEDD